MKWLTVTFTQFIRFIITIDVSGQMSLWVLVRLENDNYRKTSIIPNTLINAATSWKRKYIEKLKGLIMY